MQRGPYKKNINNIQRKTRLICFIHYAISRLAKGSKMKTVSYFWANCHVSLARTINKTLQDSHFNLWMSINMITGRYWCKCC